MTTTICYRITLTEQLLGTVPKNPNIYSEYVESKKPVAAPAPDVAASDEIDTVPISDEKGCTGFHTTDTGLFLFNYQVKGFLKHAGNVLKDQLGIKALKSKIDDYVFVSPRRLYITDTEGHSITQPDGALERPLRVMTPQGMRVCLTKSDYVEAGRAVDFTVLLLPHKEITEVVLDHIMEHGRLMGLGQWRNGGYGQFTVAKKVP